MNKKKPLILSLWIGILLTVAVAEKEKGFFGSGIDNPHHSGESSLDHWQPEALEVHPEGENTLEIHPQSESFKEEADRLSKIFLLDEEESLGMTEEQVQVLNQTTEKVRHAFEQAEQDPNVNAEQKGWIRRALASPYLPWVVAGTILGVGTGLWAHSQGYDQQALEYFQNFIKSNVDLEYQDTLAQWRESIINAPGKVQEVFWSLYEKAGNVFSSNAPNFWEKVQEKASNMRDDWWKLGDRIKENAIDLKDKISAKTVGLENKIAEKVVGMGNKIAEKAVDLKDYVSAKTVGLENKIAEKAVDIKDYVWDKVGHNVAEQAHPVAVHSENASTSWLSHLTSPISNWWNFTGNHPN